MKSEKISLVLGYIDDELIVAADALRNKNKKKTSTWIKWGTMAACVAILFICVLTLPNLLNNPNNPQDFEPLFIGLPVDNFSLADLHTDAYVDRFGYSKLSDFFSQYNGVPDIFVFVRVLDTEQIEEKNRYSVNSIVRQNSSVEILSIIWSRDGSATETLSVTQYLFGGCCLDEPTNLLREDGVYLLPLTYWEYTNTWRIVDDLDVLFEVDDKGRVWSHSSYEGFNRFDGEDVRVLLEAIAVYTSDENLSAAISRFGLSVRSEWSMLMEVTYLSATSGKDSFGNDYYGNTFSVDNILSTGAERLPHPVVSEEIKALSYDRITQIHLEIGGRYLIFYPLDEYGGEPQIGTGSIAKINDDGTITELFTPPNYSHRAFEGYNGYTVEQMKEEAERAKAWHERHVK